MRPLEWALIQSEWCPWTRRRLDTNTKVYMQTPREEAQLWSASQGETPEETKLLTHDLDFQSTEQ